MSRSLHETGCQAGQPQRSAAHATKYRWCDRREVILSLILSLEKATVFSQGREPLGTECFPRTKSPEGATETSIVLSSLRGLALPAWALRTVGKLFRR